MDNLLALAQNFAERHADGAAAALDELDPAAAAELLAALPEHTGADVLAQMEAGDAADRIRAMPADAIATFIRHLPPQVAAAILRNLEPALRDASVAILSRVQRIQVGLILRQPRQTVGAWMDSRVVSLRSRVSANTAIQRLSREDSAAAWIYAIGPRRRLLGMVRVLDVLRAAPDASIGSIMRIDPPRIRVNVAVNTAFGHPAWKDADVLPVVDGDERLVGVVRYVALRHALADLARAKLEIERVGTFMDIANIWYLGMAEILNASMARRFAQPPPEDKGSRS